MFTLLVGSFHFNKLYIYLFILFLAVLGLVAQAFLWLWCAGFSLWWLFFLWSMGARVETQ